MDTVSYVMYVMLFFLAAVLFMTRAEVQMSLKKRFFTGKGYAYIRLISRNKQEQLDFLKIGTDRIVKVGDSIFICVHDAATNSDGNMLPDALKEVDAAEKVKTKDGTKVVTVDKEYRLRPELSTWRGKYPVYTFTPDSIEPVNFFTHAEEEKAYEQTATCPGCSAQLNVSGTVKVPKPLNPSYMNMQINRARLMGQLKDAFGPNKKLMLYAGVAVLAIVAIGWFTYQNNELLTELVARGIPLQ